MAPGAARRLDGQCATEAHAGGNRLRAEPIPIPTVDPAGRLGPGCGAGVGMLRFIGGVAGTIFLIGLLVVVGVFALIF